MAKTTKTTKTTADAIRTAFEQGFAASRTASQVVQDAQESAKATRRSEMLRMAELAVNGNWSSAEIGDGAKLFVDAGNDRGSQLSRSKYAADLRRVMAPAVRNKLPEMYTHIDELWKADAATESKPVRKIHKADHYLMGTLVADAEKAAKANRAYNIPTVQQAMDTATAAAGMRAKDAHKSLDYMNGVADQLHNMAKRIKALNTVNSETLADVVKTLNAVTGAMLHSAQIEQPEKAPKGTAKPHVAAAHVKNETTQPIPDLPDDIDEIVANLTTGIQAASGMLAALKKVNRK